MWDAITLCHPDRIGHGIASRTDPKLLDALAKAGIVLEVCPTSNICTKLIDSYESFGPIFDLFDTHGVLYTICADNPSLLSTNVRHEYEALHQA
jgi:adenosine deaminase